MAVMFMSPAHAWQWQNSRVSIAHDNCLQWNGPQSFNSRLDRDTYLIQLANSGGNFSYQDKINGQWGKCHGGNDGSSWHWDSFTCGYSTCLSASGAEAEAKRRLKQDKNCPGPQCNIEGGDVYRFEVTVNDWFSCESFHYTVTLYPKNNWTWSDPAVPEFTSQTTSYQHCWDYIDNCNEM